MLPSPYPYAGGGWTDRGRWFTSESVDRVDSLDFLEILDEVIDLPRIFHHELNGAIEDVVVALHHEFFHIDIVLC